MGSQLSTPYQVVQTKAANYTALPTDDVILVDATSGNVTITLYGAGQAFVTNPYSSKIAVVKTDAGANTVTIAAGSGDAIYAPSLVLSAQYQNLALESDGSDTWFGFGGSLASVWGAISGTLANQTDLVAALALKANAASPTFTGVVTAPMFDTGFRTQATAGTTTTLTATDVQIQAFTGTTTQTVVLPVVSTLSTGFGFLIINNSTGTITVNSSGGNAVQVLGAGGRAWIYCILITGTDATSWSVNTPSSVAIGVGTSMTVTGALRTSSATLPIGYNTGAGFAVAQASSRTTGVTSDTPCGAITLVSAAGSGTAFSFTVTCAACSALDTVLVSQKSGTDLYDVRVTAVGAGSFRLTITDLSGTTTETPVFNYAIIKAVAS